MELTEKQINQISRSISILDIKSYIEQHRLEYEEFLEAENKKWPSLSFRQTFFVVTEITYTQFFGGHLQYKKGN